MSQNTQKYSTVGSSLLFSPLLSSSLKPFQRNPSNAQLGNLDRRFKGVRRTVAGLDGEYLPERPRQQALLHPRRVVRAPHHSMRLPAPRLAVPEVRVDEEGKEKLREIGDIGEIQRGREGEKERRKRNIRI